MSNQRDVKGARAAAGLRPGRPTAPTWLARFTRAPARRRGQGASCARCGRRRPLPRHTRTMRELFGDATRGGAWAAVRLLVDGQRIVRADAPGLARDLAGLTLLEAAAVGGETLAVEALASAIGRSEEHTSELQ